MANRSYRQQSLFAFVGEPVLLEGSFQIGATGAVSATEGMGIDSVERLQTGIFRVNLQDTYARFISAKVDVEAAAGSPVTDGSFVSASLYRILTVGTTTEWDTVGLQGEIETPAIGMSFSATATGSYPVGSGDGTAGVVAIGKAGTFDILGDPDATIAASGAPYLMFQYLANVSGGLDPVRADPTSGSAAHFSLLFANKA